MQFNQCQCPQPARKVCSPWRPARQRFVNTDLRLHRQRRARADTLLLHRNSKSAKESDQSDGSTGPFSNNSPTCLRNIAAPRPPCGQSTSRPKAIFCATVIFRTAHSAGNKANRRSRTCSGAQSWPWNRIDLLAVSRRDIVTRSSCPALRAANRPVKLNHQGLQRDILSAELAKYLFEFASKVIYQRLSIDNSGALRNWAHFDKRFLPAGSTKRYLPSTERCKRPHGVYSDTAKLPHARSVLVSAADIARYTDTAQTRPTARALSVTTRNSKCH